jgi:hypothetical protein
LYNTTVTNSLVKIFGVVKVVVSNCGTDNLTVKYGLVTKSVICSTSGVGYF